MLLFVEGPDKAGKSTLMREMLAMSSVMNLFSLPYPKALFEEDDVNPTDYFLGGNTFLLEYYKGVRESNRRYDLGFDLIVHRGFISEFVYGSLFGRTPQEFLTRWWIDRWPEDAAMVFVNIPHEIYIKRATGDAEPDTIPLMAPARWKVIQKRYQMAIDILSDMGKRVVRVSGEALFERQWSAIADGLGLPTGIRVW